MFVDREVEMTEPPCIDQYYINQQDSKLKSNNNLTRENSKDSLVWQN